MRAIKNIALYLLVLMVLCIVGAAVLKIYDMIMNLDFDNVWFSGFKVGLIAWIGMLINQCYHWSKEKKK